jgi:hypothetical protein
MNCGKRLSNRRSGLARRISHATGTVCAVPDFPRQLSEVQRAVAPRRLSSLTLARAHYSMKTRLRPLCSIVATVPDC